MASFVIDLDGSSFELRRGDCLDIACCKQAPLAAADKVVSYAVASSSGKVGQIYDERSSINISR